MIQLWACTQSLSAVALLTYAARSATHTCTHCVQCGAWRATNALRWVWPVQCSGTSRCGKNPSVWLSGSGGTGKTPSHHQATSGKSRLLPSGRAAVRWSRCWAASILTTCHMQTQAMLQTSVLSIPISRVAKQVHKVCQESASHLTLPRGYITRPSMAL